MWLNEDFEFSSATPEVKKAFLGVPDKMRLSPGVRLYKWTDYPLFGSNGITPWWSFVERTRLPSGFVAEGFRDSETRAGRLGVQHRDYQRVRGAVSERFNNTLGKLLLIELRMGVWGFAGRTSGQPEFKDPALDNVYLIGGKGQVWIPNLSRPYLIEVPSAS